MKYVNWKIYYLKLNFYFIPSISKLIQVSILFRWLEINIKKKKDLIFTARIN